MQILFWVISIGCIRITKPRFWLLFAFLNAAVFLFLPTIASAETQITNVSAQQSSSDLGFRWKAFLRNETAYRIDEPRAFTKIRNLLYTEGALNLGDAGLINASARAFYDHAYDIYDYSTISARRERDVNQPLPFIENLQRESNKQNIELSELYIDLYLPSMDLRLGKQITVWGVLTGVRVVDELNPMDFRELILLDLLDYRVPLWSAKADIYAPLGTFEFIWIPEIRAHKPAPPGSEWELLQEVPGTQYPNNYRLRNSEFGARLTRTILETELALSYFLTWDDFPTVYRQIYRDSDGIVHTEYFPQYQRLHIAGLVFRRAIAGQIAKGEFALINGKRFSLESTVNNRARFNDERGVTAKNHARIGLGADINWNAIDISPSIVSWYIFNYEAELVQQQWDTSVNLFLRREFYENATTFELLAIGLVNLKEAYIRPKFIFQISQRVSFTLGADILYGTPSAIGRLAVGGNPTDLVDVEQRTQFLGNFTNNKRVFVECKFSF